MYSPTVEDILKPYYQYPKAIQQAILLVETNPRFIGLTRSMKAVLKTLLTRACQTNGTTQIKARLDTVALQAEVSTKTVERTMKTLRAAGWLATMTEGRSEWGVFESKRYKFTEELCELTGLPTGKRKPDFAPKTEMSDGGVYVDLTFKEDYQAILLKKRKAEPDANPITLPVKLQPIVDLGIKPSGVCKLRGLTSKNGHQLEDIYIVAKQYLEKTKASAGRAYRYLETMAKRSSDYAGRASQISRIGSLPETLTTEAGSRAAKYAYKRFAVGGGKVVRIFDGAAEVTRDGHWLCNIVGRNMETVYDDIDAGRIIEIKD